MSEELNLEEISSTTAADAATEAPPANPEPVESNETVAEEAIPYVSLQEILTAHADKLVGCHQIDISGIPEAAEYNYLMYARDEEKDKSLILIAHPDRIALYESYIVNIQSIRVLESGVVIISDNARTYVNNSGTIHYEINADKKAVSRVNVSKFKKGTASMSEAVKAPEPSELEAVKQMVKLNSIRMYPVIKDETEVAGFRAKALEFMDKIKDINHLIKIESEILFNL